MGSDFYLGGIFFGEGGFLFRENAGFEGFGGALFFISRDVLLDFAGGPAFFDNLRQSFFD